jgi:bacterial/archaeal transporter family-2 protein
MNPVWWTPFIILAGVLQALGAVMSAQLRISLSNPWLSLAVLFALNSFFFTALFAMSPRPLPTIEGIETMPWWAPLAGLTGAVAVFAGLALIDELGAGMVNGLIIAANLATSLAIDHLRYCQDPSSFAQLGEVDGDDSSLRPDRFGGGQRGAAAPATNVEDRLACLQAEALDRVPPKAARSLMRRGRENQRVSERFVRATPIWTRSADFHTGPRRVNGRTMRHVTRMIDARAHRGRQEALRQEMELVSAAISLARKRPDVDPGWLMMLQRWHDELYTLVR